jgi:hypothetical protein
MVDSFIFSGLPPHCFVTCCAGLQSYKATISCYFSYGPEIRRRHSRAETKYAALRMRPFIRSHFTPPLFFTLPSRVPVHGKRLFSVKENPIDTLLVIINPRFSNTVHKPTSKPACFSPTVGKLHLFQYNYSPSK